MAYRECTDSRVEVRYHKICGVPNYPSHAQVPQAKDRIVLLPYSSRTRQLACRSALSNNFTSVRLHCMSVLHAIRLY